ncbi:spermidine synthase [Physcia stellaris]|nr:spermidine synthase [Physcia stellaris]
MPAQHISWATPQTPQTHAPPPPLQTPPLPKSLPLAPPRLPRLPPLHRAPKARSPLPNPPATKHPARQQRGRRRALRRSQDVLPLHRARGVSLPPHSSTQTHLLRRAPPLLQEAHLPTLETPFRPSSPHRQRPRKNRMAPCPLRRPHLHGDMNPHRPYQHHSHPPDARHLRMLREFDAGRIWEGGNPPPGFREKCLSGVERGEDEGEDEEDEDEDEDDFTDEDGEVGSVVDVDALVQSVDHLFERPHQW